ncbi:HAD family phosphatase [Lactobacillus sp. LC28-10]|uniref:HAD family phosphatase n=1 Tax=Secundilactobacillus angelensis TaxID=2722706 RepID=A0ABX1KXM2_9LACO|nr:HAD family hydrolase [Secundilactobacillus angelensis]NLR17992.1 HAD family phosphatase [Secundilactobacillus angelensis]
MIKHIFSDMDGTLLNRHGKVSTGNKAAIQSAGIPFTLVSARSPRQMMAAIDTLKLTAPQIGFNGGLIYRVKDGQLQVIEEVPVDFKVVKRVVDLVEARYPTTGISLFGLTDWQVTHMDDGVAFFQEDMPQKPTVLEPATFWTHPEPIYKMTFCVLDNQVMAGIVDILNEARLPGVAIQKSSDIYLDITAIAAKKSRGVNYIAKREQLDLNETAAFGDGPNDIPMLKLVGMPIVMANGLPNVKQVARYLTTDNDHDGVGQGIEKFILQK